MFPPGHLLLNGLCCAYDFIEHYGTGGGLCRPLFAEFLSEAGRTLKSAKLLKSAETYAAIGKEWTDLASALLREDVPLFRETRELLGRRAELLASGGDAEEIRATWDRLDELGQEAKTDFPLTEAEASDLRGELKSKIKTLYENEMAAHDDLGL